MKFESLYRILRIIEDEYFRKGIAMSPVTIEKVIQFLKDELGLDVDNLEE